MNHRPYGRLRLWGHDGAPLGPPPTAKYRLAVEPGPDVASRPTDVVAVQLGGGNRLRERLHLDRQTGPLLRRGPPRPSGAAPPARGLAPPPPPPPAARRPPHPPPPPPP